MATPSPASSRSEAVGFTVGLTGGIGSGKTTVSNALQSLGAAVVDTDLIAHTLTGPGGAAMEAIAGEFGPEFVAPDGALDRARMRSLAFATPGAKRRLEEILHPLIRSVADAQARQAAAHAPYVVLVIPLLVEAGNWKNRVDRVLVVDCAVATQIERVQRRSGLDADAVRKIIAQQATRQERLDAADDVIVNEGDEQGLLQRVVSLHDLYSRLGAARRLESL
ncbi:MAG TPA: dephospho-CoA kinase [Burkholderiaceae bacterium]|nr:dephospho-CoA kinase [Burkholderiaceae bacterium]